MEEKATPRPQALVVGNLMIDLVLGPLGRLPEWGREYVVPGIEYRPAGAAGYSACAWGALGGDVTVAGAVGGDPLGQRILEALVRHGVRTEKVRVLQGAPTGLGATMVGTGGQRAFVTHLGHLTRFDEALVQEALEGPAFETVLFCGYFLLPALRGEPTRRLMERARASGGVIAFDTGWDPSDWPDTTVQEVLALLPSVDVFLPNEDEARMLTRAGAGKFSPEKAAERLLAAGAREVVVKLGAQGALAVDGDQMAYAPAPAVATRDTTGAGDVFNAAYLFARALGWGLKKRLQFANLVASWYVSADEPRYPSWQDVYPRLERPAEPPDVPTGRAGARGPVVVPLPKFAVGVDIGGTYAKVAAVTRDGQIRFERLVETGLEVEPDDLVDRVSAAILETVREAKGAGLGEAAGVGVGVCGFLDEAREVARFVNLRRLNGYALKAALEASVGLPVVLDVDVNVAALGEYYFGAGRGSRRFLCITLGTGVGGGLVVDGRVVRLTHGCIGDIGHIVVNPVGPTCVCGGRGCLEELVAARGIVREAERVARSERPSRLKAMLQERGTLTPRDVTEAAAAGDAAAREVLEQAGMWLGMGLASWSYAFGPDRVALCGGLAGAGEWLLRPARQALERFGMPFFTAGMEVVPGRLGPYAGVAGAACHHLFGLQAEQEARP